jgi:5'-nucleotidase
LLLIDTNQYDMTDQYQILLTNDDGIQSPGLWAAAEALSRLGFVHVVAPRDQFSGAGRSMPSNSDGIITPKQVKVNGKLWTVYSVGGTPAQAVLHAVCEILPQRPDMVVSGINYGENLGIGITVSGTVGAALEAAARGIKAIAISLETELAHHLSYSLDVDFSTAAHFTAFFGGVLLNNELLNDVDLLKIDIPSEATPETPWEVTRLARRAYFEPVPPQRDSWDQPAIVGYRRAVSSDEHPPNTDVFTLGSRKHVSVTPLSLDLTSRVDLGELDGLLRGV